MHKDNQQIGRILSAAIALLVAGTGAALGTGGVILYIKGKAAVAAGTVEQILSRPIAEAFLRPFVIPASLLIVLLILAAVWKVRAGETEPYRDTKYVRSLAKNNESISAHKGLSRRNYFIVFGLIAVLIAAGALNGGLKDVLIKAVNICTECIGLG